MRAADVDKAGPTDYTLDWGNKESGNTKTSTNQCVNFSAAFIKGDAKDLSLHHCSMHFTDAALDCETVKISAAAELSLEYFN